MQKCLVLYEHPAQHIEQLSVEHFAQFKHKMIIKDGDAQKHSRTNKNVF
jgi:hypothetical protein